MNSLQINIAPPISQLSMGIVIPCHNEPDLILTLESLWNCHKGHLLTEVLVIINDSDRGHENIKKQNQLTLSQARDWAKHHQNAHINFHILYYPDLPKKYAGVGLARKIGMDLMAQRLRSVGKPLAPIICLDADCLCEVNYLQAVESFFDSHPESHAATIYFEHPLKGKLSNEIYSGIVKYELFLRYYVHGIRWAGSPYGIQTVGSSMAVRANIYTKQGGMNRRKAGEDFYFLQKLVTLGSIPEINNTTVYPSPRPSDRVPFGTGQAINKWLDKPGEYLTYHPQVFKDLKSFFQLIPELYEIKTDDMPELLLQLSPVLQTYLLEQNIGDKVEEIQNNITTYQAFRKRFWFWFNGFQIMKFIHFARDNAYHNIAIEKAVKQLLVWQDVEASYQEETALDYLKYFRIQDKGSSI